MGLESLKCKGKQGQHQRRCGKVGTVRSRVNTPGQGHKGLLGGGGLVRKGVLERVTPSRGQEGMQRKADGVQLVYREGH